MKVQVVGCSHHTSPIEVRERMAFSTEQASVALTRLRKQFPNLEAVLLSTCNRVELYAATENASAPSPVEVVDFLAQCHGIDPNEMRDQFFDRVDEEAIRHLFTVASSLDSMVLGEPQILSQVKQAYQSASEHGSTGPLTNAAFQAALKVARRVAGETAIHQRRVSIPSVAVADFARRIFERFDDKNTLVLGAGEMAEETLQYLRNEGVQDITVVNRNPQRAEKLARRWQGQAVEWERLGESIARADLVVSTTGSEEPIITAAEFATLESSREGRVLFVLDLAVPRDFDPAIDAHSWVYLYSIDDLREACDRNRRARDKEMPKAVEIIEQETVRFMGGLNHRVTTPVIRQLRQGWEKPKEDELRRLLNKLPELDERSKEEIRQSFDRLVAKLLHPPMESLRDESRHGIPNTLLEALSKLFQLKE